MDPAGAAVDKVRVRLTLTQGDLERANRMMAAMGFGEDLDAFLTYLVMEEMARKGGPKATQPKRKRS